MSVDVPAGWHVHDLRAVAWSDSSLRRIGDVVRWEVELERDAWIGGVRIFVLAEGATVEAAAEAARVAIATLTGEPEEAVPT